MKRVTKHPGDLFSIPLSDGRIGYAQWLADGTACIYLAADSEVHPIDRVATLPMAFRVLVFKDTLSRFGWSKIGVAPVPAEHSVPQRYVKKDPLSGQVSLYFEGKEVPATLAEVRGLETLAVWAHPHIVERLEAQLAGKESKFLKSVRVVA
jgi:hypothetical protein